MSMAQNAKPMRNDGALRLSRRSVLAGVAAATLAACGERLAAPKLVGLSGDDGVALAGRIRKGETTAVAAVENAISRAQALQPQLNFIATEGFDLARAAAAKSSGSGALAGVPYLIKDLNEYIGLPTKDGSRALKNAKPETKQDVYFDRTDECGLIVIGKTTTPEMGYSATTEPLANGPTRNPWSLEHTAGGSSGGAAAAVAAGVVPLAHANDGGGSTRMPASCCGIFGLKPSRGRLAKGAAGRSAIDFAAQGCVSISVRDTAVLTAGTEATVLPDGLTQLGLVSETLKRPLRIAVVSDTDAEKPPHDAVRAGLEAAVALLGRLGHKLEAARWPMPTDFMNDFMTFWSGGAARTWQRAEEALGRAPDDKILEPFTLGLAENAFRIGKDGMAAAIERLKTTGANFNAWLAGYDVVMSPVLRTPPPAIGYLAPDQPFDVLVERMTDFMGYTPIHNISGAPAMSVPLHWTAEGLPVGIQFSAPPDGERILLELAYALESAQPWSQRRPPVFAG